jgi:Lrp/AsnC family transcriptional regulator
LLDKFCLHLKFGNIIQSTGAYKKIIPTLAAPVTGGLMTTTVVLDDLDRQLLDALQIDSSQSIADLAEQCGLSQTPCWRRIKRLEEAGVIRNRVVLLAPELIGLHVTVIVQVSLKRHDEETLRTFEEGVRAIDEILDCFAVAGERDYMMRVIVASVSDYEKLLKTRLSCLPEISSISSNIALSIVKSTTHLPVRAA